MEDGGSCNGDSDCTGGDCQAHALLDVLGGVCGKSLPLAAKCAKNEQCLSGRCDSDAGTRRCLAPADKHGDCNVRDLATRTHARARTHTHIHTHTHSHNSRTHRTCICITRPHASPRSVQALSPHTTGSKTSAPRLESPTCLLTRFAYLLSPLPPPSALLSVHRHRRRTPTARANRASSRRGSENATSNRSRPRASPVMPVPAGGATPAAAKERSRTASCVTRAATATRGRARPTAAFPSRAAACWASAGPRSRAASCACRMTSARAAHAPGRGGSSRPAAATPRSPTARAASRTKSARAPLGA